MSQAGTETEEIAHDALSLIGWSNDGRYLLYISVNATGTKQPTETLNVFDDASKTITAISKPSFAVGQACWQSDNNILFFQSSDDSASITTSLIKATLSGKEIERLSLDPSLLPLSILSIPMSDQAVLDIAAHQATPMGFRSNYSLYFFHDRTLQSIPQINHTGSQLAIDPQNDNLYFTTLSNNSLGTHSINRLRPMAMSNVQTIVTTPALPDHSDVSSLHCVSSDEIIFCATRRNSSAIYSYQISTQKISKIAQGTLCTVSVDHNSIAFAGVNDPDSGQSIFVCNLDGSQLHRVYDPVIPQSWFNESHTLLLIIAVTFVMFVGVLLYRIHIGKRTGMI